MAEVNKQRLILLVCLSTVQAFVETNIGEKDIRLFQHHDMNQFVYNIFNQEENDQVTRVGNKIKPWSAQVGRKNLDFYTSDNSKHSKKNKTVLKDGEIIHYQPGDDANSFTIWTLGGKIIYPSPTFQNSSIIIHVFNPESGFLECLWTSDDALQPIINSSVLNSTHFIFIPKSAGRKEKYGAIWMNNRLQKVLRRAIQLGGSVDAALVESHIHVSVLPFDQLGNWIPDVMSQWHCVDHLCGLDQVTVQANQRTYPVVGKRLDARYDWLPSPASVFTNKTVRMVSSEQGCHGNSTVNGFIALVANGNCSIFEKVQNMEKSGAIGVVIYAKENEPVTDMTCGDSCDVSLSIPATMVEYDSVYLPENGKSYVTFQNTPSENFFMGIDYDGKLAEIGWFLYPTMNFLIWQAQWFQYKASLNKKLKEADLSVDIFQEQIMQGNDGVKVNITLPSLTDLHKYSKMELDTSLSCPGTMDTECPHWDQTVNLFVCCDTLSPLCGMELGRWISAFRRRIGRWLSDVSPLFPLLTDSTCVFNMKTVPWAMPWKPSLSLKFSQIRSPGDLYPDSVTVLYKPGATFDKKYNSNFKPYTFSVPTEVKKVEIYAVITGHGSDENGCGEFCVTSHHFNVNGHINNITFNNAGTPFGCAERVLTGVEPNEHGTWLYGRDGWCDGQNVFPWVIDITSQLSSSGADNSLVYFGWFNGTDPNPKENPGIIILYSYLVFYKTYNGS